MTNPHSQHPKQGEIRELSELFWQFHNDRLKDPKLTDMTPYIKPILTLEDKVVIAELERIEEHIATCLSTFGQSEDLSALFRYVSNRTAEVKAKG